MATENATIAGGRLDDVMMDLRVTVGQARPTVRELLALSENDVLLLDKKVDDPVELHAGERLIARGVLEEAEEGTGRLCIRLTEIVGDDAEN